MHEKFIHDLVAELLSLPLNRVINSYSNGARPSDTHATIRYYGHKQETPTERRMYKADDVNSKLYNFWTCVLEIQLYSGKGKEKAFEQLRQLVNKLDTNSVLERCTREGVAFFSYAQIQDLTAMLDKSTWESRASIDINIRYKEVIVDTLPIIEQVEITGEMDTIGLNTGVVDETGTNSNINMKGD